MLGGLYRTDLFLTISESAKFKIERSASGEGLLAQSSHGRMEKQEHTLSAAGIWRTNPSFYRNGFL